MQKLDFCTFSIVKNMLQSKDLKIVLETEGGFFLKYFVLVFYGLRKSHVQTENKMFFSLCCSNRCDPTYDTARAPLYV